MRCGGAPGLDGRARAVGGRGFSGETAMVMRLRAQAAKGEGARGEWIWARWRGGSRGVEMGASLSLQRRGWRGGRAATAPYSDAGRRSSARVGEKEKVGWFGEMGRGPGGQGMPFHFIFILLFYFLISFLLFLVLQNTSLAPKSTLVTYATATDSWRLKIK